MTPKMSMHDDEESQRLVELQTKIAYQDKTIAELNQVVIDQRHPAQSPAMARLTRPLDYRLHAVATFQRPRLHRLVVT